jgi:protein-arginine kinase activator protein McsA
LKKRIYPIDFLIEPLWRIAMSIKSLSLSLRRRIVLIAILTAVVTLASWNTALAQDDSGDKTPDDCAACHSDEYKAWDESKHAHAFNQPGFIEAWNRAGNPTYCKSCHATGYDAVSGAVDYEGVSCAACHIDTEGTHPMTDMTVNSSSELCGTCHTGTHAPDYDQWLTSGHATMNIGCPDCHQSHNTTLHLEDPTLLCTSCHKDLDSTMHGQAGMGCHDCHMAAGDTVTDALSGQTNGTGHTFGIPASVCAECHGMTHSTDQSGSTSGSDVSASAEIHDADAIPEEEATKSLNLGLTGGGVGGLLIGFTIPWLLNRNRGGKDDQDS